MKRKLKTSIALICVVALVIGVINVGYTIWNVNKQSEKIHQLEIESEKIKIDQKAALAELIKNTPPEISKKYFEYTVQSQTIKCDIESLSKNISLNQERLAIKFALLIAVILILLIFFKRPTGQST